MLLSLIIPFYGVEAYIGACLEPLRSLPEDICEILLVDDCGTDGSRSIAETFCREQRNAHLIRRKANGGLSAARNTGMDAANGRYLFFLDSDDIPDPANILALAQMADAENLDVAMGNFEYMNDETGKVTPGPGNEETNIIPGTQLFIRKMEAGTYEPMVWQCVYRREFLLVEGIRMTEGILFEDEVFTTPALLLAKRTMGSGNILLKYRQRTGSIMNGFRQGTKWLNSYLSVCRYLAEFDRTHPTDASALLKERIARIALSLGKNIPAYGIEGKAREEAVAFIRNHREEILLYTKLSTSASLGIQARLMKLSPELFIRMYSLLTSRSTKGLEP